MASLLVCEDSRWRPPRVRGGQNLTTHGRKNAILIVTHLKYREVIDLFNEINRSCSDKYDVFLLCDNSEKKFSNDADSKKHFLFDALELADLPYPGKSKTTLSGVANQADSYHKRFHFDPGDVELPVMLFYRQNPGYAFYWAIEHDVRYTGAWDRFFANFESSEADLLGTTLTRRAEIPNWYHWPSLDLHGKPGDPTDHLRGFFPIYRLSARALEQLDRDYRSGVKGHFECLIPTLLHQAGMKIEDIGGGGEFVQPRNRNRFYRNTRQRGSLSPGTMVYRPVMHRPGRERNMLWHPVKRLPAWEVALIYYRRLARAAAASVRRFGWVTPRAKKRKLAG